ncbi:hypothetical protein ACT3TS_03050 [Specibacter sp. AOP5-B1-6]|uniref:hypothetical protein n=1 Tax=Specibacter sp. AOP5-B1-6 TaxID=3457653 RepID=UPI00402BB34F
MIRGWIGAIVSTTVAAASHVLAGGHSPVALILVLSLVLSGLVCTILAGRLLSLWRLMVGVLLSQALFHGLFNLGVPASTSPVASGHNGHSVHQMAEALQGVQAAAPVMDHSSPLMWLSHILAAVFTVAVLRHGETVFVGLLDALRLRVKPLLKLVRVPAAEAAPAPIPGAWPVRVLSSMGIPCSVMRYRGPPPLSALF